MLRRTLVLLLVTVTATLQAQIAQPGRFEIELDTFDDEFFVLSGNEQGVLLYKPLNVYDGRNQLWKFIKLDTALQVQWEKEFYLNMSDVYRGFDYSGSNFSLLFQITDRNSLDLRLLQLDEFNGDTSMHRIKNLVKLELDQFEMNPEAAVIAGYYNTDPVVIHYDLKSKKSKVLPGIYGSKTELAHVRVDDDFINILLTAKTYDNSNTLALKTYSPDGDYLDSYTFQPAMDVGLVFGRVAKLDRQGSLICGTYGNRKSEFSRGLFIAQHNEETPQEIRYFNFADLDNFFTYLKAKRQKRISEKITRKKIKGKKLKFNYRLLVHDIMKNGDEYIMIGEAFYPKYNSYGTFNSYTYGFQDFSGNNYVPSSFAGYRYTHAVVIGFNSKGEILWDNSFQINDVLSYQLEQFVHADVREDKIVLLYLYENEIRSKIISGSEVVEGMSFNNMRLTFEDDIINDKSSYADVGGLEKWYDHTFLAYGVQKIKNLRDQGVKLNRKVFYINKVKYDQSQESEENSDLARESPKIEGN